MDDIIDRRDFRAFRYSNFNIYDLDASFDFPDKDQADMFGKINIFFGENNTGKSRLIRHMANIISHNIKIIHLIDEIDVRLKAIIEQIVSCIQDIVDISNSIGSRDVVGQSVGFHETRLNDLRNLLESDLWREMDDIIHVYSVESSEFRKYIYGIDIYDKSISVIGGNFGGNANLEIKLNDEVKAKIDKLRNLIKLLPKKNELDFCNIFIGTMR